MSSIESATKQASPFDGLPDQRFFYRSLSNLEVLSALRFGIEARRGLILFTGEVGTGKSVVLQELVREMNSRVTCILVPDPHVRFRELLRLILRDLEVEVETDDEAALLQCCKTAVRSALETNRIISLAIDDAQDLPDEVIESLVEHFVGKGFDPANNLLQIVLAGRPELRKRLLVPPLRSLDTQVEIECRLQPLDVREVGLYLKHRLSAAHLPVEIFDLDAIESVAVYSDGRPGLINAIGRRALEMTDQPIPGSIPADIVAGAAKDLDVWKAGWEGEETLAGSRNTKADDDGAGARSTTVVTRTFPPLNDDGGNARRFSAAKRSGAAISVLLVIVLLGISAAWLQGESPISYVQELGVKLDGIAGATRRNLERDESVAKTSPRQATEDRAPASLPDADPAPQSEKTEASDLSLAKTEKSAELPGPVPPEHGATNSPESLRAGDDRERRESSRKEPEQQRKNLANQVSKAIENRAILGVAVSVSDGVAYLDGQVATREQRTAAERAARGVPQVRAIQNRIAVE
jgi:general secretion pathway protein A